MRSEEIGPSPLKRTRICVSGENFFGGLALEEISVLRSEEISLKPRQEFILGWYEGWVGFYVCSFLECKDCVSCCALGV